jgi:amino acid adenylation domain-containing protein
MSFSELLTYLRTHDVQVWVEGDRLRLNAPRGVLTPELQAELARHKEELIELLRTADAATRVALPPIQPAPRTGPLPLSFSQQRLWFLDQLTPDTAAYNIVLMQPFHRSIDVGVLDCTFTEIVRRHEILRTTFVIKAGHPVQQIAPPAPFEITQIDLRALPEDERQSEVRRLATLEVQRSFDLAHGPLWRVILYTLSVEEHWLLIVVHHIVFDGSSIPVLARELEMLYQAFTTGQSSPLPEPAIQYADFASWQRHWLQGDILQPQLDYWKQQLAGLLPVLNLPTDRRRPAIQTDHGALRSFEIDTRLVEALNALGQQSGTTLFMLLLAAFNTLLYRYSGQDDILVGLPIANRTRAELENLIGFFVNTLVLRTDLSGEPNFRELLSRVREMALAAYAHQDLPFETLVEALQPERDASRTPLFQVMFVFEQAAHAAPQLDSDTAKYDLTLYLWGDASRLTGTFEYNTDLFDAATIDRMVGHFRTLLEAIVATPDRSIATLPILTTAERQQVLVDWNDTAIDYPQQTIQALFEAQIARTPEAVAVMDGLQLLTFSELNVRANQVAHHLRSLGIAVGTLVGICLPRSIDLTVSLLGILKAGGAYVPLDPAYPKERLAFMLQDSGAAILLTQRELADRFPDHRAHVLYLDGEAGAISQQSVENPNVAVPLNAVAYVTYTSGSTGTPKGVQGLQRGAVNRFHWMWRVYPFQPDEVCCQKTYLSFVDSVWEIYGPLLRGVPIVIIPDAVLKDDRLLIQTLADHQVTRIVLAPSLLRVLLAHEDLQQRLPHLKYWSGSGEALPLELAQRFWQVMPNALLLNMYGSSEAAADSIVYEVKPDPALTAMLIGRPIDNTQVYLLDARRQLVPIGVPGEIYVGGDGLARGYHERPDLTAERFIANPFDEAVPATLGGHSFGRLYKTGDLGRYRLDGNIEYLGRIDYQVKVRGFRIELGEIESNLKQHPAVHQAVVVAREASPGDMRLVAYIVLKDSASQHRSHNDGDASSSSAAATSSIDLRAYLQAKLPEYMLPAVYITLEALPLTPSGKIDRRALPELEAMPAALTRDYIAPRDAVERQLVAIWEDVLHVKPIGVHSNFFELGGHSLLAIELFAQIEKVFGRRPPLTTLFQSPTIEQLAKSLRVEGWSNESDILIAIQPGGSRPPFFCVHGFGGGVIDYGELARLLGPDQPFYGLQARGRDGVTPLHTQIEEMAAEYIATIRTVQPQGPYFLGGYCYGGVVAYEMARQLQAGGESAALVGVFEGYAPVRLNARGPVGRPRALLSFLRNVPYWLRDYLQLGREQILARLSMKLRGTARGLMRVPGRSREIKLEDYLPNVALIPPTHQFLMQEHLRALRHYRPGPYRGRVTLFRVRAMSLFRAADPEMGWGKLAQGGVDVRMIAGGHNTILEQPFVQSLAEQLTVSLEAAQRDHRSGTT